MSGKLTKKQKATEIYFNEADPVATVKTYHTKLVNSIRKQAAISPETVIITDELDQGGIIAELPKAQLICFCAPEYSGSRKQAASERAKELYARQKGIHRKKESII